MFPLSDDLNKHLLTVWIALEDVARLDSAFCCTKSRPAFVKLCYSNSTVHRANHKWWNTGLLRWCIIRSVRVDGICVGKELADAEEMVQEFLSNAGQRLEWVTLRGQSPNDGQRLISMIAQFCGNLKQFDLHVCKAKDGNRIIWDKYLADLCKSCPHLSTLSTNSAAYTTEGLRTMLGIGTGLKSLTIHTATTALPAEIALPTLTYLDIRCCDADDQLVVAIAKSCSKLQTLYAFERVWAAPGPSPITDVGVLAVLQGCPQLREIDVEHATSVSPELRVELVRHCQRRHLNLSKWKGTLTEAYVVDVLGASPPLLSFDCDGGAWLTDTTLARLAEHSPSLQSLRLATSRAITAEGLRQLLLTVGPTLKAVTLDVFCQMNNSVVWALVESCPLLESISFVCLFGVTAEPLVALLRAVGRNLRTVRIRGCSQLPAKLLGAVATHCPLLEQCDVEVHEIDDALVAALAEGCPKLREVCVLGSYSTITEVALTALATHCKRLQVVTWRNPPRAGVRALLEGCRRLRQFRLPPLSPPLDRVFGEELVAALRAS